MLVRVASLRGAKIFSVLLGAATAITLFVLPLRGGFPVVRVAPIILAASLAVLLAFRPWVWSDRDWERIGNWNPSTRFLWISAGVSGLVLFWFVLTRFQSTQINAIDLTVYYDRPTFQTSIGRLMYVESADDPARAYRSYLAVHAHWIMWPLAALYRLSATPLWLLALSVVAVVGGAIHTLRIVQACAGGGMLAVAAALAFVLNDNTARTLNYGFHTEVLYAWSIPSMIHAGLQRRWRAFSLVALASIAVKEDAFLLMLAVAALLVAVSGNPFRRIEWICVIAPVAAALLNLALYYRYVVPHFSPTGAPFYAAYWANYGPTTTAAAVGMLTHPVDVLMRTLRSGFLTTVMPTHLYFPLLAWRWFIGSLPIVLLYGASANEQLRSFGVYYAVVLVPFLVIASAFGAKQCAVWLMGNTPHAYAAAATLLVVGSLVSGISSAGYSLRPWRPEVRAVSEVIESVGSDRLVLVQSALYPHAGYSPRVQLLSPATLNDPRYADAALVLAPELSAYPLSRADMEPLNALPVIVRRREGTIAVERASKH